MLGGVDALKRKLIIPPRFVPYMEKHGIYELFYDFGTKLVMKKPDDHISYLKQCTRNAVPSRDVPRIIMIAPPDFDKIHLADALREELGVQLVTTSDIYEATSTCMRVSCTDSQDFARNVRKILETEMFQNSGWVLTDMPRTTAEIRAFQQTGIIPTHVLQINPKRSSSECENEQNTTITTFPVQRRGSDYRSSQPTSAEKQKYQKHLRSLRTMYQDSLVEVDVGNRSIDELAKDCSVLMKTFRKHRGAPSIFRIVIIGARGSGRRTVAEQIAKRFHLVHVNLERILHGARLQNSNLGRTLRMIEHRRGGRSCTPEMRVRIVEECILGHECMKRGWILTGCPYTEQDFRLLDMLATPPNRVIFLEVDSLTCEERILGNRSNILTGSSHNITSGRYLPQEEINLLAVDPNDYISNVKKEIKEYEDNVAAMMNYAGSSATLIDGSRPRLAVYEMVEAFLIRPAPRAQARVPAMTSVVRVQDIEFDPDDEVDLRVFDGIRLPERVISQ